MATLTVQDVVRSGLNPSYASAAAGGDDFPNDGKRTFAHVKNGGASAITVTLDITQTVDGQAVTDPTVSIPAGEERMIGPFPVAYYGASVGLSYSDVTSVTVAAIRVP